MRRLVRITKPKVELTSLKVCCAHCGKDYPDFKTSAQQKGFCTKRCFNSNARSKRIVNKKVRKNPNSFYFSQPWRELRYKALLQYGRKCLCCGALPKTTELHVDHIKPISRYPDLALQLDNLQILCSQCNLGKSNKDETDFR